MKDQNLFPCKKVILIDDNPVDIFIIQKMLTRVRFTFACDSYNSIRSALAVLSVSKTLPDFIILDLHFDLEDGFSFLDQIQSMPVRFRSLKIIAITASVNPNDQQRALQYDQVITFIQKPITEKHLRDLMSTNINTLNNE